MSAEVLLLSIDPGHGGLIGQKKRVLAAVRKAGGTPDSALDELKQDGLVRGGLGLLGGRVELVDRAPAARRFRELQEAIRADSLADGRDTELFVLLAWSGVLAQRLPKHERRTAANRLRRVDGELLEESDLIGAGLAADYDSGGGDGSSTATTGY